MSEICKVHAFDRSAYVALASAPCPYCEIAKLRWALEFYADPQNHKLKGVWQDDYPGGIIYEDGKYTMCDTGNIARTALDWL